MEESGENWPSDSNLERSDDLIFYDGEYESVCGDDEDQYCEEIGDPTNRKGRNEVKERLLALSATIPGLKKMDDTSILEKTSNYVKQLQERVRELEQEVGSSNCNNNNGTTTISCKVNLDDNNCETSDNIHLPEVKAKVLQKEILIIIHCEKQKDVLLKILTHLENLHLSLVNSSVLQFGKSILDITIVAQMSDGYNITVDELVKTLRIAILTQ